MHASSRFRALGSLTTLTLAGALALIIPLVAFTDPGTHVPDARAAATLAGAIGIGPRAPILAFAGSAAPSWTWPVSDKRAVLRPFAAPPSRFGSGHRGIDIAASSEIRAPADGVVSFVGFVVDRPVLSIRHSGGVVSSFEPVESLLNRGQEVRRGDVVGLSIPGHCPTACIHVGVRLNGEYVSPLLYLGGIQRAILLPTRAVG